jgi:hypothetical protein
LARISKSATCVSVFFFLDFLIGKVSLSFKNNKGEFGFIFSNTSFYVGKHIVLFNRWIKLKLF